MEKEGPRTFPFDMRVVREGPRTSATDARVVHDVPGPKYVLGSAGDDRCQAVGAAGVGASGGGASTGAPLPRRPCA